jgi:hypothetical protein
MRSGGSRHMERGLPGGSAARLHDQSCRRRVVVLWIEAAGQDTVTRWGGEDGSGSL